MTQEDIIKLAREAGLADSNGVVHAFYQLERFASLVAAAERESVAASSKRDLTCVCGAVWDGEQMVHAPRKREWVGLTDEEVSYCRYAATFCDELDTAYMAELIEKDLKEKNHG